MHAILRWLLIFGCCLGGVAHVAHADRWPKLTSSEARSHLARGNKLYSIRSFDQAVEEYKAGALVEAAPIFDYNLGQCYRQLGKYQEAIWHYERFLTAGNPQGEVLDAVNGFIAQMKSELDKQAMTQKPTEPAPVAPNSVLASSANAGHRISTRAKLAIGIGGGGGLLVGVGVILGFHARSLQQEANDICPMVNCNRADEANALIQRGKDNALYANLAYGVGVAAVVGAIVLWLTAPSAESGRLAVTPQVTSKYAGFDASWRF